MGILGVGKRDNGVSSKTKKKKKKKSNAYNAVANREI